jgi:predicted enzyme related to lactoylglutathione lyase
MNVLKSLIALLFLALSAASVSAQESGIEKFGLYVVATDLNKSSEFYAKLFQKPPYIQNDRLVGFEVAGGLYAIFAAQSADQKVVHGNSTVPYIRVKDADHLFERVKALGATLIDKKVLQEGPIKLFRFVDPDGNTIELFSLVAIPQ